MKALKITAFNSPEGSKPRQSRAVSVRQSPTLQANCDCFTAYTPHKKQIYKQPYTGCELEQTTEAT